MLREWLHCKGKGKGGGFKSWSQAESQDFTIIAAKFSVHCKSITSHPQCLAIKAIFRKYFAIDVRIVFTTFKVSNYFSLKCHTPLPFMAKIVYKFQCLCDADLVYIGKTMRHLATRVREHGTSASAIHYHLSGCASCHSGFSYNSFS